MTQAQLAEKIGATQTLIHRIEENKMPINLRRLYTLAGALGLSPRKLIQ